jgi:hypothetical protein
VNLTRCKILTRSRLIEVKGQLSIACQFNGRKRLRICCACFLKLSSWPFDSSESGLMSWLRFRTTCGLARDLVDNVDIFLQA